MEVAQIIKMGLPLEAGFFNLVLITPMVCLSKVNNHVKARKVVTNRLLINNR
jgi:hypothetical protein